MVDRFVVVPGDTQWYHVIYDRKERKHTKITEMGNSDHLKEVCAKLNAARVEALKRGDKQFLWCGSCGTVLGEQDQRYGSGQYGVVCFNCSCAEGY